MLHGKNPFACGHKPFLRSAERIQTVYNENTILSMGGVGLGGEGRSLERMANLGLQGTACRASSAAPAKNLLETSSLALGANLPSANIARFLELQNLLKAIFDNDFQKFLEILKNLFSKRFLRGGVGGKAPYKQQFETLRFF